MGISGVVRIGTGGRRRRLTSRVTVTGALTGAVTTLLLVAGCASDPGAPGTSAPPSIAISESPGWPADAPYPEREWEGPVGPIAWWGEGRETITVISYGSSSCPYIATELTALAEDRVSAVFVQANGGDCTDDLAPRTHVLATPEGLMNGLILAEVEWREPLAGEYGRVQVFDIAIDDPDQLLPDPPASAAINEYPGLPAEIPEPDWETVTGDTVLAYWLSPPLEFATERELTIVTFGSSTCPTIPSAVDPGLAADTIGVTFQSRNPEGVCTADLSPFTSVLAIPLEPAATAQSVEATFLSPEPETGTRTVTVDIIDLAPPR